MPRAEGPVYSIIILLGALVNKKHAVLYRFRHVFSKILAFRRESAFLGFGRLSPAVIGAAAVGLLRLVTGGGFRLLTQTHMHCIPEAGN